MALKMVLTHGGLHGMTHDEDEEDTALPTRQTQDDKTARAELQELKNPKAPGRLQAKCCMPGTPCRKTFYVWSAGQLALTTVRKPESYSQLNRFSSTP